VCIQWYREERRRKTRDKVEGIRDTCGPFATFATALQYEWGNRVCNLITRNIPTGERLGVYISDVRLGICRTSGYATPGAPGSFPKY
jgi:hypothetical protein